MVFRRSYFLLFSSLENGLLINIENLKMGDICVFHYLEQPIHMFKIKHCFTVWLQQQVAVCV